MKKMFLLLGCWLLTVAASAQAPGGVSSNIAGWFKAGQGVYSDDGYAALQTTNGGNVKGWKNLVTTSAVTGVNRTSNSNVPKFYSTTTAELLNYNPTIYFSNGDLRNTGANILGAGNGFHFYVVLRNNYSYWNTVSGIHGFLGNGGSGNNPAMDYQKDFVAPNALNYYSDCGNESRINDGTTIYGGGGTGVGTSYSGGTNEPVAWSSALQNFQPQIMSIGITGIAAASCGNFTTGPFANIYTDGYKVNSKNANSPGLLFSNNYVRSNGFYIGSSYADLHPSANIAEVIAYSDELSDVDRRKLESYLAIKYGITLGQGGNSSGNYHIGTNAAYYDYVTSGNVVVWSAATGADFNTNIAGMGRDDGSVLNQKQSKSVNWNRIGQVTIALGSSVAGSNAANTNDFAANGNYLVWGDNATNANDDTKSVPMSAAPASYIEFTTSTGSKLRRIQRVWQVQNTGVNQPVTIQYGKANVGTTTFPSESSCAMYVLIASGNADFTSDVTVVPLTDDVSDAGTFNARYTFPAGVSYFTFAKIDSYSGLAYLALVNEPDIDQISPCLTSGFTYYYSNSSGVANERRLFAINWNGNTPPAGVTGNITLNGGGASNPPYSKTAGSSAWNLMGRFLEIQAAGTFTVNGGVKVRIYYSPGEKAATELGGAVDNVWFKRTGTAADAIAAGDIATLASGAVRLIPSGSGTENGVDYVEFDGIQSFSTFGYYSSTSDVLPVTFGPVSATFKDGQLVVNWQTLTETNNSYFEIEASADGKTFTKIGEVKSLAADGNSSTALDYSFTKDAATATGLLGLGVLALALVGANYNSSQRRSRKKAVQILAIAGVLMITFAACSKNNADALSTTDADLFIRIKQVDKDGSFKYSKTVKVVNGE
jgi:hypothetical protein